MGLSMAGAITIFLKTVCREKRIPFEIKADNQSSIDIETRRTLERVFMGNEIKPSQKGFTMSDEEMQQFVEHVGRCELFEELEDFDKLKAYGVKFNKTEQSRYLKAIRVALATLGYDEEWVDTKLRNSLQEKYLEH